MNIIEQTNTDVSLGFDIDNLKGDNYTVNKFTMYNGNTYWKYNYYNPKSLLTYNQWDGNKDQRKNISYFVLKMTGNS